MKKTLTIMIRKTNKNWLVLLLLFAGVTAYTQCNYQLVETAAQQAGSNTVFLRDFKVRLSEASMDDPVPTGRFPVYLNEGVNYRFNIANSAEINGKAFVDLMRRGQIYASNINTDSTYINTFDFACERSATYQLEINFGQGQEGCAAIVMSLVLQDSLTFIEPGVPIKSDSLETLYLWVDNELQIATTLGKEFVVKARVSQGEIVEDGKFYIIHPERIGELNVYAEILTKKGDFKEADTVKYFVELPPFPNIVLPGERAGVLSLHDFTGMGKISLESYYESETPVYKLKQFAISKSSTGLSELISHDHQLSNHQIEFIKNLKAGDSFFMTGIEFIDPENRTHRSVNRQVFIVE